MTTVKITSKLSPTAQQRLRRAAERNRELAYEYRPSSSGFGHAGRNQYFAVDGFAGTAQDLARRMMTLAGTNFEYEVVNA